MTMEKSCERFEAENLLTMTSLKVTTSLKRVPVNLDECLLACLQLSVDVDEDAVLSGLRTIVYPEVAA